MEYLDTFASSESYFLSSDGAVSEWYTGWYTSWYVCGSSLKDWTTDVEQGFMSVSSCYHNSNVPCYVGLSSFPLVCLPLATTAPLFVPQSIQCSPSFLRNKQIMQVSRLKALSRVVTTFTDLSLPRNIQRLLSARLKAFSRTRTAVTALWGSVDGVVRNAVNELYVSADGVVDGSMWLSCVSGRNLSKLQALQACKNEVYLLPKQLDEVVAQLYFHALGAELNVLTREHIICVSRLKGL